MTTKTSAQVPHALVQRKPLSLVRGERLICVTKVTCAIHGIRGTRGICGVERSGFPHQIPYVTPLVKLIERSGLLCRTTFNASPYLNMCAELWIFTGKPSNRLPIILHLDIAILILHKILPCRHSSLRSLSHPVGPTATSTHHRRHPKY